MKAKPCHKLLLSALIVFACLIAKAQTKPLTATEKAADVVCAKFNNVDISSKTSAEIMTMFQDALVHVFADNMQDLENEMGFDTMDGENGRKIGEEIGRKLLLRCPKFIDISIKMAKEKKGDPPTIEEEVSETSGTITKVISPDFTEVMVKDTQGRESTFYWLRYFKGSENFETAPVGNIGKKVKITWTEMECYLPKAHGYYKIKEIKSIDFLK
jgi:hypothetical protein